MSRCLPAALVLGGVLASCASGQTELGKFEPATGCYLGAYIELDPAVRGDLYAWEELTGRRHASYLTYVGYGVPFPLDWARKLAARGCLPQIGWEPNRGLDQVRDDVYLRGFAEAASRVGGPVLLRFASEMNSNTEAYSGRPELFIEKWRLVHDVLAQMAPKVALVWCVLSQPQVATEQYYPGDDYVDWVGVNIYSVHHHREPPRLSEAQPVEELRYVYSRYAARKPIAVCEFGAAHYCPVCRTEQAAFAVARAQALYQSLPREFPRVKLINWFSVDAATKGIGGGDYAVTVSAELLAAYRELIAPAYFLDTIGTVTDPPQGTGMAPPGPGPGGSSGPPEPRPEPIGRTGARITLDPESDPVTGRVQVGAQLPPGLVVSYAEFRLDGRLKALVTAAPYEFEWDTTSLAAGEHVLELVLYDDSQIEVDRVRRAVAIQR